MTSQPKTAFTVTTVATSAFLTLMLAIIAALVIPAVAEHSSDPAFKAFMTAIGAMAWMAVLFGLANIIDVATDPRP